MAYPAVGCIQCTVLLRTIRRCTFFSGTPWREPAFGPVRVPISRTWMDCGRAAARPYRQKAALVRYHRVIPQRGSCPCASRRAVGCIQCTVLLRTIRRCTFFSGTPWREPAFGPVRVPISRTWMDCGRAAARPYRQKPVLARYHRVIPQRGRGETSFALTDAQKRVPTSWSSWFELNAVSTRSP